MYRVGANNVNSVIAEKNMKIIDVRKRKREREGVCVFNKDP